MRGIAISFFFSLFLVNVSAQDDTLFSEMISESFDSDTRLDPVSFYMIKTKMDSILQVALRKHNELDDDIFLLQRELELMTDGQETNTFKDSLKVMEGELERVRKDRTAAIDLQLKLTYNPESYLVGEEVIQFLNESHGLNLEIQSIQGAPLSNESFYFEIDKYEESNYSPPCEISYNQYDNALGMHRKETTTDNFFAYTNSRLKPYFKEKDFLNCKAGLTKVEDDYFILLEIDIESKNAKRSYGTIEKGGLLVLHFVNGDKFSGSAIINYSGELNTETGVTSYRLYYYVDNDTRKAIHKLEITKIGLFWSSGYEDYKVYEVDLLMHKMECLKSKM